MKSRSILAAIFALSIAHKAIAYRTDIDKDGEKDFCAYRKHLTFKPTATCCANQAITPGLDITEHWDDCVKQNGGKSDTVEGVGWDIYSCILEKALGKDKVTLQEFADLMTAKYPDNIKSKINTEIQSQKLAAASLSNHGWLEKLRVTYYDIEKEVCEGMPSETKSYGKIEMCSNWKEENHRAGMCCRKSYPVDIRYNSLFDVGVAETIKSCEKTIRGHLNDLNATEMMRHSLLEICDVACAMAKKFGSKFNMKNNIMENTNFWNFNVTQQLLTLPFLIPNFIPQSMRAEITTYLNATFAINNTIEAMQNFEFADVVGGNSYTEPTVHFLTWVHRGNKTAGEHFKYEFMGRRFHKGILHVPVFCAAYGELVKEVEAFAYQNCKPEDVTEAPAPEEEKTPDPVPEPEPETTTAQETPAEPTSTATPAE